MTARINEVYGTGYSFEYVRDLLDNEPNTVHFMLAHANEYILLQNEKKAEAAKRAAGR